MAREQQRRAKIEEVAARRLEGELVKLHQVRETARQAEAALREQLTTQGIDLAQARTRTEALAASVEALEGRIDEEKSFARENTGDVGRALISKSAVKGDTFARRQRKPRAGG